MMVEEKTYFAVTIDVDPDVNLPVPVQTQTVSAPAEKGETRFGSCAKGLESICKMLDELKIPATFFFEARTAERLTEDFGFELRKLMHDHEVGSHAYMHEDFLGKDTGTPLDKQQMKEVMEKSLAIITEIFQRPISGFRAPYVRINDLLAEVLVDKGFFYDSSITKAWKLNKESNESFQPYYYFEDAKEENQNPMSLIEVPLPNWEFPDGKKLSSYFWPVLEGDVPFSRYAEALDLIGSMPRTDSLVILATHPWHLVETYAKGVIEERDQVQILEQFQSKFLDLKKIPDIEFVTLKEYIDIWQTKELKSEIHSFLG